MLAACPLPGLAALVVSGAVPGLGLPPPEPSDVYRTLPLVALLAAQAYAGAAALNGFLPGRYRIRKRFMTYLAGAAVAVIVVVVSLMLGQYAGGPGESEDGGGR